MRLNYLDGCWRVTVNWMGSRTGLEHFLEQVECRLFLTGDTLEVDPTELKDCKEAGDAHDHAEGIVLAASVAASLAAPGLKFSIDKVIGGKAGMPPSQYVFATGRLCCRSAVRAISTSMTPLAIGFCQSVGQGMYSISLWLSTLWRLWPLLKTATGRAVQAH